MKFYKYFSFYKLSNDTLVSAVSVLVKKIFAKNRSDIRYFLTDFSTENTNMNDEIDYESDDDDSYNKDEPYRSKLRQKPARNTYYDGYVLNYIVSVF